MLRIREFYLVFLTLGFIALLTAGYSYLNTDWLTAFFALFKIHLAVAGLVFAILAIWLRRGAGSLILFVLSFFLLVQSIHQSNAFSYTPPKAAADAAPSIKIIEFNILGDNRRGGEIAEFLINSGADIVSTLESRPLRKHLKELSEIYPFRIGCGEYTPTCDSMILSKYPLTQIHVRGLSPVYKDRFIETTIRINNEELWLVSIHFSKPYFDRIFQMELRRATKLLRKKSGPLLVVGDFNAPTLSPDIQRFMAALNLTKAPQEPNTWPVQAPWIGFPIDHIFTRQPLAIRSIERLPAAFGSNHFGLQAEIAMMPEAPRSFNRTRTNPE